MKYIFPRCLFAVIFLIQETQTFGETICPSIHFIYRLIHQEIHLSSFTISQLLLFLSMFHCVVIVSCLIHACRYRGKSEDQQHFAWLICSNERQNAAEVPAAMSSNVSRVIVSVSDLSNSKYKRRLHTLQLIINIHHY